MIAALDRALTRTRPAWWGLGQLALVILGVHLAADRLDDLLLLAVRRVGVPWGGADAAIAVAAWVAVGIELLVVLYAAAALTLTPQAPSLSWRSWSRGLSVAAFVLPVFWAIAALSGSWVVAMAVEDGLAGLHPGAARILGAATGLAVAWRLAFTGWKRVVAGLAEPKNAAEGLVWAPLLLGITAVLLLHGLPLGLLK